MSCARAWQCFSLIVLAPLVAAAEPGSGPAPVAVDPLPEAPAPRIGDAPSEAELRDLAFIAQERGMSLEEGIARYGWQNNFALAVDQARAAAPQAFSGAEIVDATHAWVAFSGLPPQPARASTDAFREAFPSIQVEVRTGARLTERDLETAMEAVCYSVFDNPDVLDATAVYEPQTATIVTRALLADTADADALLARLRAGAADRLSAEAGKDVSAAIKISVLRSDAPALSGDAAGVSRHKGGEVWSTCTSGFGTRRSSSTSGTRGIASAGHCPNPQYDDGSNLTLKGEHEGTHGDFEGRRGPKVHNDNFFAGGGGQTETDSRDVSAKGNAVVNQTLCRNGKTTHKKCQEVRKTPVCAGGECNLVQMGENLTEGGDSGGPVYFDRTAYGIHKGWMTDPFWPFKREIFSKATRIDNALGVYIATN